ncbi:hypothetical protein MMC18_005901 [Xylographa bjoerkii]|nr:hypothetical protein [Xylographa bjoerkii]
MIHRTVSIAALLAIALTLTALLEYVSRVLPDIGWEGDAPQRRSLLHIRQESLELTEPSLSANTLLSSTVLPQQYTGAVLVSAYLDTSTLTLTTDFSDYLDAGTTVVQQGIGAAASTTTTVLGSTIAASAYLDTGTAMQEAASTTAEAAYMDTSTTIVQQQVGATVTPPQPSAASSAYSDTGTTISETAHMSIGTTTVEQIQPSVTISSTGATSFPSPVPVSSAYLETNTVTDFATAMATDYLDTSTIMTTTVPVGSYLDTSLISTNVATSYLLTDTTTEPLVAPVTSIPLVTVGGEPMSSYLRMDTSTQLRTAHGTSIPTSKVQILITTFATQPLSALSTTTISASTGIASVAFALPSHSSSEISANKSLTFFTQSMYFCGAYLPILLAVGFRVVIGWLYVTTKMIEPFRILTQSKTTSANDFFNINYLSASDTLEPYKAMLSGHWLMLWTSLLYLAVELLSPFASEVLHFYWSCESTGNDTLTCAAALWINVSVARILQGLLSFASMMLAIIWFMIRNRSSELLSDPSSIITIASLLHHPETLAGLRSLDQLATKADTIKSLDGYSYRLGTYTGRDGNERYGLIAANKVQVDQPSNAYDPLMTTKDPRISVSYVSQEPVTTRPKRWKPLHIVRDIALGSTIAAILVIVAVYYVASGNSGFNIFMNSNGFGPRFLVTCVGVIIHSQWARLERECAGDEPFRRLYRGSATAESTILTARTLTPISTVIASIYQRNFFVVHIAFVTLLSEVLIIILPGVPFSPGEIWEAGMMSIYLSMAILGLMLLTFVALMLRPKGPDLARKPNTLGAMFMYLCDSSMTPDFADLSCLGTRVRDQLVREKDRLYSLKYDLGTEGSMRWQVDYDTRGEKGGALMSDF